MGNSAARFLLPTPAGMSLAAETYERWVRFAPGRRPPWLPEGVVLSTKARDSAVVDVAVFSRSGQPIVRLSGVDRATLEDCSAPEWATPPEARPR